MKEIILSLVLMFVFVGCNYATSKTIYINSKKVIVENWDDIPEDLQNKLIKVDETAKTLDILKTKNDEFKEMYINAKKKDVGQTF